MIFKEYLENQLNEVLITVGKKAYPKFGHIVILAGGGGSGKGFVQSSLLGIEGKTFDVDALKSLAQKSDSFNKKYPGIKDWNLKDPENVAKLHQIVKDHGLENKKLQAVFDTIMTSNDDRKPNLIFDVTLKEFKKIKKFTEFASKLNYPKENIHIVWVLTELSIALEQNKNRERFVPEDILINTHKGAAKTMIEILKMGNGIKQYLDGDIIVVFNRKGKDSIVFTSSLGKNKKVPVLDKALYIKAKESGKSSKSIKNFFSELKEKMFRIMDKKTVKDTQKWLSGLRKGKL